MPILGKYDSHWLKRPMLTASALGLSLGTCPASMASPFGTAPISDEMLSGMRGGYDLPNGMKISIGMQIDTRVDGALALRTVMNVTDRSGPALQVTVPAASSQYGAQRVAAIESANPTVAAAVATSSNAQAAEPVSAGTIPATATQATIDVPVQTTEAPSANMSASAAADPAPAGAPVSIPPVQTAAPPLASQAQTNAITRVTPAVSVAVQNNPANDTVDTTPSLSVVSIANSSEMPAEIQSDLGRVTIQQTDSGSTITLKGPDLEIQHITGNATGILIANTLDNRAIDTVANINISLTDSAIPIGNVLLRIESIVLDAVGSSIY